MSPFLVLGLTVVCNTGSLCYSVAQNNYPDDQPRFISNLLNYTSKSALDFANISQFMYIYVVIRRVMCTLIKLVFGFYWNTERQHHQNGARLRQRLTVWHGSNENSSSLIQNCTVYPRNVFKVSTTNFNTLLLQGHQVIADWVPCPAHVVQWSNHLGAMCSRAWRSQWPRIDSSLGPGASAY